MKNLNIPYKKTLNKNMKYILLILISLFGLGCGEGSTTVTTTAQTQDLTKKLKGKSFFAVEDNINSRSAYTISFDSNLTSWNIKNDTTDTNNTIKVTSDTITNSGGLIYTLQNTTPEYMNLVAKVNPLISLRLFNIQKDAENYYKLSLKETLKNKEFFTVQNDATKRTLFKIKINKDASSWDITSYDNNYTTPSSTAYGLNITLTDTNLTDSGGASFLLNTQTKEYLRVVSTSNQYVTLKFYNSAVLAQSNYNSQDLRTELKNKTFYTVYENNNSKKLYQFAIDANLSSWNFSSYASDFNQTALQNGTNTIRVTENRLLENQGDILYFKEKTPTYIELRSATNGISFFRLYKSANEAQLYFNK